MKLLIVAVGNKAPAWVDDGFDEYARRMPPEARIELIEATQPLAAHLAMYGRIDVALDTGLSQGLIESTNNKIRLLTRVAFGFHGPAPLIALAMLALGSHPPQLPRRH